MDRQTEMIIKNNPHAYRDLSKPNSLKYLERNLIKKIFFIIN